MRRKSVMHLPDDCEYHNNSELYYRLSEMSRKEMGEEELRIWE